MKRTLLLLGAICWFLFALGFLFLLAQYIAGGAGLQFWIPVVSSGSVLVGLVHVVGFCIASVLCFAIGSGLWARGVVMRQRRPGAPASPSANSDAPETAVGNR
jgi:hypothetical protein